MKKFKLLNILACIVFFTSSIALADSTPITVDALNVIEPVQYEQKSEQKNENLLYVPKNENDLKEYKEINGK